MWVVSLPGRCSAAASPISASPRARPSCYSQWSIARTRAGSHGRRSTPSLRSSAWHAQPCRRHSARLSRRICWSNTSRDVKDDRRGIALLSNWPDHRASCGRSTSPIHGASSRSATSPTTGHEVIDTYVGRSAVAVRALPGARRSLRSLVFSSSIIARIFIARGRAEGSTFPLRGRRGNRTQMVATRRVTASGWSLLRRLPASLARTKCHVVIPSATTGTRERHIR